MFDYLSTFSFFLHEVKVTSHLLTLISYATNKLGSSSILCHANKYSNTHNI